MDREIIEKSSLCVGLLMQALQKLLEAHRLNIPFFCFSQNVVCYICVHEQYMCTYIYGEVRCKPEIYTAIMF